MLAGNDPEHYEAAIMDICKNTTELWGVNFVAAINVRTKAMRAKDRGQDWKFAHGEHPSQESAPMELGGKILKEIPGKGEKH